jgi:hypothetical protein
VLQYIAWRVLASSVAGELSMGNPISSNGPFPESSETTPVSRYWGKKGGR